MSGTVQANDGAMLPLDSLPQTFAYSGGFISSITVFYANQTYIQTFTNDGTNITYISGWNNSLIPPHNSRMVTEAGDPMITETGDYMVTE